MTIEQFSDVMDELLEQYPEGGRVVDYQAGRPLYFMFGFLSPFEVQRLGRRWGQQLAKAVRPTRARRKRGFLSGLAIEGVKELHKNPPKGYTGNRTTLGTNRAPKF